jgi:hypothetical protein
MSYLRLAGYQFAGVVMRSVLVLWLAVWVAGCSAAGQAAVESVGTLASSFGSAATGYQTAQSTKKLNEANDQVALANAALTRQQAGELNLKQNQVEHERPVVVRILNKAAETEHDPMLQSVALWVASGGDPDYAFKFWLSHEEALATAPTPHPTLELPNHQPALQPKIAEARPRIAEAQPKLGLAQPKIGVAQSKIGEEQPNQSELIPKQALLAGAPESPQASLAPIVPPQALSNAQLPTVAPGP